MQALVYARGGRGGWGSNSPSTIKKNIGYKPLFLKRSAFFHAEFAEIAVMYLCAVQLA